MLKKRLLLFFKSSFCAHLSLLLALVTFVKPRYLFSFCRDLFISESSLLQKRDPVVIEPLFERDFEQKSKNFRRKMKENKKMGRRRKKRKKCDNSGDL